ncbi:MAG: hypothetical protein HOW71_24660 [Nonomuraea sp.]|nr:hypothetical protein [Nonomuraea sp.]
MDKPDTPRHAVVLAHGRVLNRHPWHYQRGHGGAAAGARLVVIPGGGHLIGLERPETVDGEPRALFPSRGAVAP